MKSKINPVYADAVLNLFFGHLPYGANYFMLTYRLQFEAQEWENLFEFLIEEGLIEPYGSDDKQCISEKGIDIISQHCGVEKYLEQIEKQKKT